MSVLFRRTCWDIDAGDHFSADHFSAEKRHFGTLMAGSHIFSPKFNCWSDLSSSPRESKHAHATDLRRSPISLLPEHKPG